MKTLIVTEKPSVAKDIAAVLGRFERKDGYLENREHIISWAFGHLVELADPSVYNPAFKKWQLATLPILPDSFQLVEIAGSVKQLRILKRLLHLPEVSQVVNGCDAGREGESIFRRIYRYSECRKPIKRLWLSETTPAAVKAAFNQLRDGRDYDNLAAAAEARGQADWLVGINGTRAFTLRQGTVLSVGRVQTPTLNLMVVREREIKNFKPSPYWEIWAIFQADQGSYRGKWFRGKEDRLENSEVAQALIRQLTGEGLPVQGRVTSLEQKEVKERPPFLFNLNDLQKEGNRKYGFTAQQILDLAQALYEKHKLLTYPRTDSRHLSKAMLGTLPERLAALKKAPSYAPFVPEPLPELSKRYVDDGKITDHHAIIPTAADPTKASLREAEQKIYDLVARRFLSIFYPEARYAVTEVVTEAGREKFKARGRMELAAGWKILWRDNRNPEKNHDPKGEENEDQSLPPLTREEVVEMTHIESQEKQTKPPKRYTEATLLTAMESAGKLVDNKDMAEVLKQAGGIGTPATRAAIIERLIQVGYIRREKKNLLPTDKGETLIDLAPEQLKSVELTADWEEGLRRMEEGRQEPEEWIKGIKEYTRQLVQFARNQEDAGVAEGKKSLGICPVCRRDVTETPRSYGCTGYKEGCKFVIWKEIAQK
ncbi:DNA topoisomerase 3, partial [Desulforamulus ruminis]|uniref:DNA topoisomerase 3 n=1 Tax=Desulforamulus ruminis TaxID=1564 RepID=UPI0023531590